MSASEIPPEAQSQAHVPSGPRNFSRWDILGPLAAGCCAAFSEVFDVEPDFSVAGGGADAFSVVAAPEVPGSFEGSVGLSTLEAAAHCKAANPRPQQSAHPIFRRFMPLLLVFPALCDPLGCSVELVV